MTATPQLPDLRPQLTQALTVAAPLVAAVGPDDLGRPTPCTEFEVRGLLDHLVMVVRRVRVVVTGGRFDEVPQVLGLPDDELGSAFATGVAELEATLPDVDLAAPAVVPFGTMPVAAAIGSYVGEVLVHAWDLAAALGRLDLLGPAAEQLATGVLPSTSSRIPGEGREHIPFGDVVAVPDDAPALDRLVGWLGRDPHWA